MPLAAVASHALDAPTLEDVRAACARLVPQGFDPWWTAVCRAARVPETGSWSLDQLDAVCEAVVAQGGMPSVAGRSMKIRVLSYRNLAK